MRLHRAKMALWAAGSLAVMLLIFFPVFHVSREDRLDRKLRAMAGPNAVDCGTLQGNEGDSFDAKANAMETCTDRAHDASKPFTMRQNTLLDGVEGAMGFVRTPGGHLYSVYWNAPRWLPFSIESETRSFEPGEAPKPSPRRGNTQSTRYWLLR